MWGSGLNRDQRAVSELYGTLLIVSFSLLTALFLVGAGFVVVGQLTTDTTDGLTRDSMRNVDRAIEEITGESVDASTSFEFPEGAGEDVSAAGQRGTFNITIRTANDTFWQRTVANASGLPRTGREEMVMGTIRHESDENGVTAYQGGGLWRRPASDGDTLILSEPNVYFKGDTLAIDVVNLTDVEAITEGTEVQVRRNVSANRNNELQRLIEQYSTDRYNPSVTAPVEVNVTIESRYADGWATYAEQRLSGNPANVIYPYNGDEHMVRIVFGEIGDEPAPTHDPAFGDANVLYSGTSDLAYMYHNDSAYGDIDDDPVTGPVSPDIEGSTGPIDNDEYELALYNESGRWVIYNGTDWVDGNGDPVNPAATEAINTSTGRISDVDSDGVDDAENQFAIDPPRWLDESGAAPICVVTNATSNPDIVEYIDEEGEDCLANTVGIDSDLVDPLSGSPEFNVSINSTSPTLDTGTSTEVDVGERLDVTVNVTNEGIGGGSKPLGVYVINTTNWHDGDFTEATLLNGTSDVELDPQGGSNDSFARTYEFTAQRPLAGDEWVVFATTGTDLDFTGDDPSNPRTFNVTEPVSQFDVEAISPNDPVVEGENLTVDVTVNESAEQITAPQTQDLRLEANGTIVAQKEVTLGSGAQQTVTLEWQTTDGDAGTVTLEASTYDDTNTTTAQVQEAFVPAPDFNVSITDVDEGVTAGGPLDVEATVENVGTATGDVYVELRDFDGDLADVVEVEDLADGSSTSVTLTWPTQAGDAGTGTVTVSAGDDDDTETATLGAPGVTTSNFQVETGRTTYGVTGGDELTVQATVENVGNESDTQFVYLTDVSGSVVDSQQVSLGSGASTTLTLGWNTTVGDSGTTGNLTVASNDDSATPFVEVFAPSADAANFTVTVEGTNSPVTEGENLTVTATIENTGNSSDTQQVVMEDFDGGPVDIESVTLNSGGSVQRTFTWETVVGNAGTGQVSVVSADDADSAPAEVQERENEFRDPVDVAFVIDETGSMNWNDPTGERIDATRNAIGALNESLGDRAAWVQYSTNFPGDARTPEPLTNNLDTINSSLGTFASGTTNISAGIAEGERALDGDNESYIILLTDGLHNQGAPFPDDVARDVDENVTIYTVGFGGYDASVLQEIATEGGSGEGRLYDAANATELEDVFEDIVTNVTAPDTPTFDVTITDTNHPVRSGDTLTVNASVTNTGPVGGERIVTLADHEDTNVDSQTLNLSSGETSTVTLQWDTTGVTQGPKDITVSTVSDSATTQVTITPPIGTPSNFVVQGIDVVNGSMTEGEQLMVNATIFNEGAPDTQEIGLWDFGESELVDTHELTLNIGEQQSVILAWNTSIGDAGLGNVTVTTNDHEDSREVLIEEADGPDSNFLVSVDETAVPDQVTAGNTLTVPATVTNNGSEYDEQNIVLQDLGDSVVAVQSLGLDPGASASVTLSWTPDDSDTGTGNVTVASDDDQDSATVQVQSPTTGSPQLSITSLSSPGSVTAGNTFTVDATLENVGTAAADGEWVTLEVTDGGTTVAQDYTQVDLSTGATTTVPLQWTTASSDSGNFDFTVETDSDSETGSVSVTGLASNFDADIVNTNDPVTAGDPLDVVVEVENTGSVTDNATVVLNDTRTGTAVDIAFDVEVAAGGTETVTLTWNTRQGDGAETPIPIRAELANSGAADSRTVRIEEATNLDASSLSPSGSPVDIDLEEIDLET